MITTPEGAAAACIFALSIFSQDKKDGEKALKIVNPNMSQGIIQLAKSQLASSPWLMGSYFTGTDPGKGYKLPDILEFEFTRNRYSGSEEEGSVKVFTACTGAASPRPVTLKKRPDGTWYPHEWSSLIVGVVAP